MTYQTMIQKVWEATGRNTDWPIYDDDTNQATFNWNLTGTQNILALIREAEVELATTISRSGRIFVWNHLIKHIHVKFQQFVDAGGITGAINEETTPSVSSYTDEFGNATKAVITSNNGSSVRIPGSINVGTDFTSFKDYVLIIESGLGSGQQRIIVDCSLQTNNDFLCTFNKPWDTLPDATSVFRLYRNWIGFNEILCAYTGFVNTTGGQGYAENIPLSTVTEIDSILKVVDITNNVTLKQMDVQADSYSPNFQSMGNPTQYFRKGNNIYFNTLVNPNITFQIEVYLKPRVFNAIADNGDTLLNRPDFPEQWHSVIRLKTIAQWHLDNGEYDISNHHKNLVEERLATTHFDGMLDNYFDNGSIGVSYD